MTIHLDPDPTPPHGTPRPMTEETVFLSPCETYKVKLRFNPSRLGWEVITYDATTGEMSDLPNVRPFGKELPNAFACYETALSVALGIENAWMASYYAYCIETPVAPLVSRGVVYGSDDAPSAFGGALDR